MFNKRQNDQIDASAPGPGKGSGRRSARVLLALASSFVIVGAVHSGQLPANSKTANTALASRAPSPAQVLRLQSLLGSQASMGARPAIMPRGLGSTQPTSATARPSDASGPCANAPDFGWLHTDGVWVVDDNGCKMRLTGVTWYGMQTINYVPAGLNYLGYVKILQEIKKLGFNSVRIPITDQMIRYNNQITIHCKHGACFIKKQRSFKGLHPLEVLDKIVTEAQTLHLWVILDNHGSAARSVASDTGVGPALWYQKGYTQQNWIDDWTTIARRYVNNPAVVGFDIRNEPHTNGPGPWSVKTYLKQGATWGSYPDKRWNPATDWAKAATDCGNAILAVNPHLLIFVEGVQLYPRKKAKNGVDQYWWGSILTGVATDPIQFDVPNQLVYSPHEWGPWKYYSPQFYEGKVTYSSLSQLFYHYWAFILDTNNYPNITAPIWLGEFNTCDISKKLCVDYPTAKKPSAKDACKNACVEQGWWFHSIITYLKKNPEIGWSYYPLNGTNSFNQASNNSVLNKYWKKVKLPALMTSLKTIEKQPAP